jgi:hypothetical protein
MGDACSSAAPSCSTRSGISPGAASIDRSRAPPTVNVPVLSNNTHHVLARAVVEAAVDRGLPLPLPRDVHETMGSGIHGTIATARPSAPARAI